MSSRTDKGYDVAQVCTNGHPANASSGRQPQHNKEYCEECGEKTTTTCPNCSTSIRGRYWGSTAQYKPPAHCRGCGRAFPWTQQKMQAAQELAVEVGGLAGEEVEEFRRSIQAVVRDTPDTQVAAHRMKKLLGKIGREGATAIRSLLVDIASETAKKILWP